MGEYSLKTYDIMDIQERYEETSGNILLTLRSITQKPLQYFLDNKDFTKVRDTSNSQNHILRLTKLLASSSLQPRRKSIIQTTRTSPTLKDTGRARSKHMCLKKSSNRDGQSKDEALGVTINAVILLVLLR